MFERKEKKKMNLKGCFKRSIIPTFLVAFVLIVTLVIMLPMCNNMRVLNDYANLLKELSVAVDDSQMSDNPVNAVDDQNMKDEIISFVKNKEDKSLFDEYGNFIYENLKLDNIEFLKTSFSLDKRTLASFINSLIGAGWIDGFYDTKNSKKFVTVLEVKTLQTENEETMLTAVCKVDLRFFIGDTEDTTLKKLLDDIDNTLYLTYSANFKNQDIISSTLWVNKLSEKCNNLLINILTSDNTGSKRQQNLNSIMTALLNQLNKMENEWGITYQFVEDKIIFSHSD